MRTVEDTRVERRPDTAVAVLAGLATIKLALHLATNHNYDYFRDELYYIACSKHLALGYVDHPPLSIFLLAVVRWTLGESLFAIRLLPAVAGAALVVLAGLLARALGGGRFAQALAGLSVVIAPVYFAGADFFSMNAFEPLSWMLAALIVIRLLNSGDARLWVAFGVVVGFGAENKHSMLFFTFAVMVAVLLTRERRHLVDKHLWLGAAVACLLLLPNVLWQATHGWATLEFMHNARAYKNAPVSPGDFVAQQIVAMHPFTAPIWVTGLVAGLGAASWRRYRLLGLTYVVILVVFIVAQAKVYYLTPIYPMLLAAGATVIERCTSRRGWRWLRPASIGVLVVGGAVTAPLTLPVLPVEMFARYADALHLNDAAKRAPSERQVLGDLPQYYADMFGWREMVATVAHIYDSLPPDDRAVAAIYARNYGEAGALDFFGKAYGLPAAISGHNTYWLWGPRDFGGAVVITVNVPEADLARYFESVVQAGATSCRFCMPFENNRPIFVCRGLKKPLAEIWPELKRFI